jgi:hypothetical protein
VKREDLPPVGLLGARASLCTALIAAWIWYGPAGSRESTAHQRLAFVDLRPIPALAVLVGEPHDRAGSSTRRRGARR